MSTLAKYRLLLGPQVTASVNASVNTSVDISHPRVLGASSYVYYENGSVITLTMTTEEFLTLVSENVEIAQGIFRLLLDGHADASHTVLHGQLTPELQKRVADGLQALDGLILLQSSPLLGRATSAELVKLAAIARVTALAPGATIFKPGDEAAIYAMLTGTVNVGDEGGHPERADSGDLVGLYEALSGRYMPATGTVGDKGAALRIDRAELFELMADNIGLLQGVFSGLLHATRHEASTPPATAGAAR